MNTKFLCLFVSIAFFMSCNSDKQDEKALALLQKVGEAVHSSEKKSFTLTVDEDKLDADGKITTNHSVSSIKAIFPNKLFVNNEKENHNYNYWYDGTYFTYYSKDENNYVTLEAPPTTAEMIDSLHRGFNFKFPAGDFFYPSFKEDIEKFFAKIVLNGNEAVDGEACTKIIAQNENINITIWVSDATSLPVKFNIIYKNENNRKYEATFSNWDLNPDLSDSDFEFVAPENSRLVHIMAGK